MMKVLLGYVTLELIIYVGVAIGVVYFIHQRRREKKEEAKKDYSKY